MGVSGAKQTHEVRGGVSRQEVAKTCRRNVPGEANPGEWTPRADDVEGTEIPWKAPRTRRELDRWQGRLVKL